MVVDGVISGRCRDSGEAQSGAPRFILESNGQIYSRHSTRGVHKESKVTHSVLALRILSFILRVNDTPH